MLICAYPCRNKPSALAFRQFQQNDPCSFPDMLQANPGRKARIRNICRQPRQTHPLLPHGQKQKLI